MRLMLILVSCVLFAGCSEPEPQTGKVSPEQLEKAREEVDALRNSLAKERALRAIAELKYEGKLFGESERLLNVLLGSSHSVDQVQGSAVLIAAVKRDASFFPVAIQRVKKLQRESDDPEFWKEIEAKLRKVGEENTER